MVQAVVAGDWNGAAYGWFGSAETEEGKQSSGLSFEASAVGVVDAASDRRQEVPDDGRWRWATSIMVVCGGTLAGVGCWLGAE